MRIYEGLFILRPELEEEQVKKILSQVEKLIQDTGGKILQKEEWGVRKLAYPIKKCEDGYYVILNFEGNSETAEKLKTSFRREERILRLLVFRKT